MGERKYNSYHSPYSFSLGCTDKYPDKTTPRGEMANPADASMHAEESKPSKTSWIWLNIGQIEAKLITARVDHRTRNDRESLL